MTFEEQEAKYLTKAESPEIKFVKEAGKHLIGIAKCKAKEDMKELVKHHEALDKTIHLYVGEEGKTSEEKK